MKPMHLLAPWKTNHRENYPPTDLKRSLSFLSGKDQRCSLPERQVDRSFLERDVDAAFCYLNILNAF